MVADKVEEVFLVKRLASEIKPNRNKNFLVLDSGEVGLIGFFVLFFEACHRFYNEAKAGQNEHNEVQSDTPGNR